MESASARPVQGLPVNRDIVPFKWELPWIARHPVAVALFTSANPQVTDLNTFDYHLQFQIVKIPEYLIDRSIIDHRKTANRQSETIEWLCKRVCIKCIKCTQSFSFWFLISYVRNNIIIRVAITSKTYRLNISD